MSDPETRICTAKDCIDCGEKKKKQQTIKQKQTTTKKLAFWLFAKYDFSFLGVHAKHPSPPFTFTSVTNNVESLKFSWQREIIQTKLSNYLQYCLPSNSTTAKGRGWIIHTNKAKQEKKSPHSSCLRCISKLHTTLWKIIYSPLCSCLKVLLSQWFPPPSQKKNELFTKQLSSNTWKLMEWFVFLCLSRWYWWKGSQRSVMKFCPLCSIMKQWQRASLSPCSVYKDGTSLLKKCNQPGFPQNAEYLY